MAGYPFFLYRTGAVPTVVNGGVRSMLAFWMGGASNPGGAAPPTPTPTPTPKPGGAGRVVGLPHRGPYGPAFPTPPRRSMRDLYRSAFPPTPETVAGEAAEVEAPGRVDAAATIEWQGPSPLPLIMDLGTGPVALGISMPSMADARAQIMRDDEEAMIVILAALT